MRLSQAIRVRPTNCDPTLGRVGSDKRCPHCRQFHLRPGYCQALDPINRDRFPEAPKVTFGLGVTEEPKVSSREPVSSQVSSHNEDVSSPTVTGLKRCAQCGEEFVAKRPKAIYCSTACRKKAHREKKP